MTCGSCQVSQVTLPTDAGKLETKTYFGVYAGYPKPTLFSVSIGDQSCKLAREALETLGESADLRDWAHGGRALSFESAHEWARIRPALLGFVDSVMEKLVIEEI
ncbi:hypothetical protein [Candidatus Palauibacter sp.]|uniref:hypothetical protein n=1 Tax=Candidatus Palauibacter sp. TaxID=3101350 RepID=UPI003B58C53B